MGISGITAQKGEAYFLSRAKGPVNQWLGLLSQVTTED
jgi:hypothetical protein